MSRTDGRDDRRTAPRTPDRGDRYDPKRSTKPDRTDTKKPKYEITVMLNCVQDSCCQIFAISQFSDI